MKRLSLWLLFFAVLGIQSALAQTYKVKGNVVSKSDNEPLIGVSILQKGTTNGVVTDIDGNYELQIQGGETTLVFSYIGLQTQELKVNARTGVLNVAMEDDSHLMDDVVVVAYGVRKKGTIAGSVSTVKNDKLENVPAPSFDQALQGQTTGLSVISNSGEPSKAATFQIRGTNSINSGTAPLFILDGVPISSSDFNTISPSDIESISVLKDASSTSIYGARAMAGVIVVTTKKGKAGSSRVNYTGEFTTRLVPSYNDFNIMNSQEQMGIYKQMEQKGWLNFSETIRAAESGVYGKMYQLMNTFNPSTGLPMLQNTESARNSYLQAAEFRNTDWFDVLFSPSLSQNHSVSISSGTDKSSFYASLSAMYDPGWYKRSSVERYTANVNTSYNISKWLSFNMIANASYRNQEAPGTLGQDVDVVSGEVKRDFDINPYSYALNTSRTLDPNEYYTSNYAPFNILNELENNYMDLNIVDVKFQGELKWKPVAGLEFSALGAVKYQGTSQEHKIKDDSNQAEAYRAGLDDKTIMDKNPFLYTDPDNPYALPISVLPEGGIYRRTDYKMLSYDFRGTVNYNKVFNEVHLTNWFGGMEVNAIDRTKSNFQGWGMQYANGETPYYIYQYFKKGIEDGDQYFSLNNTKVRSVAFFANANYSYAGRYSINGTIRYEGTNLSLIHISEPTRPY